MHAERKTNETMIQNSLRMFSSITPKNNAHQTIFMARWMASRLDSILEGSPQKPSLATRHHTRAFAGRLRSAAACNAARSSGAIAISVAIRPTLARNRATAAHTTQIAARIVLAPHLACGAEAGEPAFRIVAANLARIIESANPFAIRAVTLGWLAARGSAAKRASFCQIT